MKRFHIPLADLAKIQPVRNGVIARLKRDERYEVEREEIGWTVRKVKRFGTS